MATEEEQRKLQASAVKEEADKEASAAIAVGMRGETKKTVEIVAGKESDFLTQAKTLREEQAKLIEGQKQLEADKTEFKKLMSEAEQAGQSLAGKAAGGEPTKEETITANAKKLLAGTGFEDRI